MKKAKLDVDLMKSILANEAQDTGIFISLLSFYYIQITNATKRQFFKSLKASINDIEEFIDENK